MSSKVISPGYLCLHHLSFCLSWKWTNEASRVLYIMSTFESFHFIFFLNLCRQIAPWTVLTASLVFMTFIFSSSYTDLFISSISLSLLFILNFAMTNSWRSYLGYQVKRGNRLHGWKLILHSPATFLQTQLLKPIEFQCLVPTFHKFTVRIRHDAAIDSNHHHFF